MPPARRDHKGERRGRLTILETVGYDAKSNAIVRCQCDCGREVVRNLKDLRNTSQCARWDHDKLGQRFGRLVVIDYDHSDAKGQAWYRCKCDCGNETLAKSVELTRGDTKSCGCWRDESMARHRAEAHVDNTNLDLLVSEPSVANSSGIRGVSRDKTSGLWHAYINLRGTRYSLGYYRDLETAAHVRRDAEQELFDPVLLENGWDATDEDTWRERVADAIREIRARYSSGSLTATEAAELLGISRVAVVKAIKAGRLEGEKIGGRWSVDPTSVDAWLQARGR